MLVGVVLAAGYGTRLSEFSGAKHKCLVPLNGVCLIDYNLDLLKRLDVERIVIVVGYNRGYVEKHVGTSYKGTPVVYAIQEPPRGVADALRCALPAIGGAPFFMCLADELLFAPTFHRLKEAFRRPEAAGVCGVVKSDQTRITKAYTLDLDEKNEILRVLEKPRPEEIFNEYQGTGYCLIGQALARLLQETPPNAVRGEYEMCDWFTVGLASGLRLFAAEVAEENVNINTREDLLRAGELMKGDYHEAEAKHRDALS